MTEHEFNTIFHKYRMTIFYYAYKLLQDTHEAEEITSLVFIKLWESKPILLTEEKTRAWLYISARQKAIDLIRVNQHRKQRETIWAYDQPSDPSQDEIDSLEIHSLVMLKVIALIKSYTAQERVIFNLHFLQALPPREIADILKSKPQTVKNQLVSIRKKIMAQIKTGQ